MMNQQRVAAVCHIIETNSRAAELLRELRNRDAVALLRQGMQCMLEEVITERSNQEGCETDESTNTPSSSKQQQQMQHQPSSHDKDQDEEMDISYEPHLIHSVVVPIPETDMSVSPDTVFRPFNRAFVFASDLANKLPKSNSELSAFYDSLSATIMYNTGLALHTKAIAMDDHKLLKRALHYYEISFATLSQLSQPNSEDFPLGLLVLLMAVVNNLGHIYTSTFNMEKSRFCRDLLHEMLENFAETQPWRMEDEDLTFFRVEKFFMEQELSAAPAA